MAGSITTEKRETATQGDAAERRIEDPASKPTLALLETLAAALNGEEIRYCQWKGTYKRERWATGQGDIDLLVGRGDLSRFLAILCRLGFRQFLAPPERQVAGTAHYFGRDATTGTLVHLHVHSHLLVGPDLAASYHLPMEAAFLQSARVRDLFAAPAPELEYVVCVLRSLLGWSLADWRRGRGTARLREGAKERGYLRAHVDPARVSEVLEEYLPDLDMPFFEACAAALGPEVSGLTRLRCKRALETRLQRHARRPQDSSGVMAWAKRLVGFARRRLAPPETGLRPAGGGMVIALIGGDGAGKSTCANGLSRWLSQEFVTRRIHLGKPPRSLATWLFVILGRIGRGSRRLLGRAGGAHGATEVDSAPGMLDLLRWVGVARDRAHLYRKARRWALEGALVICDRYPVPQIQCMDGPNIERALAGRKVDGFAARLLEIERRFYREILPPDLLILLRVAPEVAVARKTDEDAEHVRVRSQAVWDVDWRESCAHRIDASRPAAEVLQEAEAIVWEHLG